MANTYNQLNLPLQITITGGTISYLYDALGQKVQKTVIDTAAGTTTTSDYLDGFQYTNAAMILFPTAEGYVDVTTVVSPPSATYNYAFNYTDHLGDVRLTFGVNAHNSVYVLQENNYYPFGMKHKNYNVTEQQWMDAGGGDVDPSPCTNCKYKYKYNGKELQDELGLNLYDYGARNYDPLWEGG
jgi:YD repeat-containing protein